MSKKLNMIDTYGTQDLRALNKNIFTKIKNKRIVTNGNYCKIFEKKISNLVKSKYTVVCNNGTSAILMSILALNKKNIIAILPNINFVAAANIISLLKGKIILCDINKNSGMVDLNSFKKILDLCKKKKIKPNLFIPIHYGGDVIDLNEINSLCLKNKIDVIEDGCHSFNSQKIINKRKIIVGSCKFSKLTTFSFHGVKNITTLEGGAITTNNKKIYERLLLLRSHSLKKTKINEPYTMVSPTLNFRMCELSALIGIEQLKTINRFKLKRNKLVKYYLKRLTNFKSFLKPLNFNLKSIFWHLFSIHLNGKINKAELMKYLKKEKIGSQIHYKPLYKHNVYKNNILINDYKNSNYFYKRQLTLPLHTLMDINDVEYITIKLKKFFKIRKID
jgi:dTDP-4-amino-4,6-dideoxygalactose transaminase